MEKNTEKMIELEQIHIFLQIPKETVRLEVKAQIYDEEKGLINVSQTLSPSRVRELRQAFLDNVDGGDDYDARFVITEEGMGYLAKMKDGEW